MIGIIDYKAGNLTSVKRALDYLGVKSIISNDPVTLAKCERIIFPGVGNAASACEILKKERLDIVLKDAFVRKVPILGICLGAQIILSRSEEGDTECIGLIEGVCRKLDTGDSSLKIPHIGWNGIDIIKRHYVLKDVAPETQFYFVHSFYPQPKEDSMVFASCTYGRSFSCAIGYKNLFATQFHPEKSGPAGLALLKKFSTWDGSQC
jgi:imidazole glycerol-phosphate synthase subunit HisH